MLWPSGTSGHSLIFSWRMSELDEKVIDYLINHTFHEPSILDLGCGAPSNIFCQFKEFRIKSGRHFKYTGIDIMEAFRAFHNGISYGLPAQYDIEMDDWVSRANSQVCNGIRDTENFDIEVSHFDEYLSFHFETDAKKYLDDLPGELKFDCIVISNVLHFLEPPMDFVLMRDSLNRLSDNGVIYVCVLKEEYNLGNEPYRYNHDRYMKLRANLKVIDSDETDPYYKFLGVKKY
jgi:hypothetical protein